MARRLQVGKDDSAGFRVGEKVYVVGTSKMGVVKYAGPVHFSSGIWVSGANHAKKTSFTTFCNCPFR